jgi:hypothetical protein
MEENSSAAVEMVEESEVVVEAAEAEKPESSIAVEAPKPKPVRKCSKCGHPSGNSVGKIRYGRIIEVVTEGAKKYEIAAFCDGCAEGEKPVFKIGYLISQIGDMNAQAQAFELARGYWERVVRGIESPEVRKTLEGKLACGVPGCWRCKDNLAAVEHFVVVKIEGKPVIVGICPFQAAALAKCGAEQKLFVTKNFGEARRQVETEVAKAKAFAKAKAQWLAVDAGDKPADEVDLPEDRVDWSDWRTIRWVETDKARRHGGRAGNRQLTDIPPSKIIVVREGFDGLHSWKRQTPARRQWARHLRKSWGRGRKVEAA